MMRPSVLSAVYKVFRPAADDGPGLQEEHHVTGRILAFLYGLACYAAFLVTFLYAIGFVGNLVVPRAIDATPFGSPFAALAIDLGLLGLFAVQHSVMARPSFKRVWTRLIPPVVERSTFVLASSAALGLLFLNWRPLGGVVWNVPAAWARAALLAAFACGWLTVFVATLLIDHLELFGVRQVWNYLRGTTSASPRFTTPGLYRVVRHPLYLGFLLAFWSAPTMTLTHLVFALTTTAYILIAIQLEERNLIEAHPEYVAYRRRVPMLLPRGGGRVTTQSVAAGANAEA
jgi:methanethiol S-methyltransferase